MTIKEIFNENEKEKNVFSFPWYTIGHKYSTVNIENFKLMAWHCPRVEVINNIDDESICLVDDRSVFDAGSDRGEGIAVFDPLKVKVDFINGDIYSANRIIFKRV